MKRDMDLIREILIECEKQDGAPGLMKIAIEGHSDHEINYHLSLLNEAGLIEARALGHGPTAIVQPLRLTWNGHEFLSAARSSKVWDAAKEFTLKTTGTLTLEALKMAIPHVTKLLMGV
jgi:hypothetical protein